VTTRFVTEAGGDKPRPYDTEEDVVRSRAVGAALAAARAPGTDTRAHR
jgi:hypothetical protein